LYKQAQPASFRSNEVERKVRERFSATEPGGKNGEHGNVRLMGSLGGKQKSNRCANWEGRGGAQLAHLLLCGCHALSPFLPELAGVVARQPSLPAGD